LTILVINTNLAILVIIKI